MDGKEHNVGEAEIKRHVAEYERILRQGPPVSFGGRSFGQSEHVPLEIFEGVASGVLNESALGDFRGHLEGCRQCQHSQILYGAMRMATEEEGKRKVVESEAAVGVKEFRPSRGQKTYTVRRPVAVSLAVAGAVLSVSVVILIGNLVSVAGRARMVSKEVTSLQSETSELRTAAAQAKRGDVSDDARVREKLIEELSDLKRQLEQFKIALGLQKTEISEINRSVSKLAARRQMDIAVAQIGDKLIPVEAGFIYQIDPGSGALLGRSPLAEVPRGRVGQFIHSPISETPAPPTAGNPGVDLPVPPPGPKR